MDAIGGMGFDYVASGHYANVIHPCADGMNEPSVLELSQDMVLMNLGSVCLLLYVGDIFGYFQHCLENLNDQY